jgi:hypothetical protein
MAQSTREPGCSNWCVSFILTRWFRCLGCPEESNTLLTRLAFAGFAAVLFSFYMASRRMREQKSLEMNYWLRARVITQGKHILNDFHLLSTSIHRCRHRLYNISYVLVCRRLGKGLPRSCPKTTWAVRAITRVYYWYSGGTRSAKGPV